MAIVSNEHTLDNNSSVKQFFVDISDHFNSSLRSGPIQEGLFIFDFGRIPDDGLHASLFYRDCAIHVPAYAPSLRKATFHFIGEGSVLGDRFLNFGYLLGERYQEHLRIMSDCSTV